MLFSGKTRPRLAKAAWLTILLAGILLLPVASRLAAAQGVRNPEPALYFYPAPYRMPSGEIMFSPVTLTASQITTAFPQIPQMSGVVLMVYWSQLCPRRNECDFSIIDDALSYWRSKGKKVVLGVVTVAHPLALGENEDELISATPEWVLHSVATYTQAARILTPVHRGRPPPPAHEAVFPVYWDPVFIAEVRRLIASLARFDGDPALAQIRICTGIMCEDNPTWDGLRSAMPGFSNAAWIDYSRKIVDFFAASFHKTQIEFDIDRMGFISVSRSLDDRQAVAGFMNHLLQRRVFLAMDGLDQDNVAHWLSGDAYGPAASLGWVARFEQAGLPVGVEGATSFNPRWTDLNAIVGAISRLHPSRLVLFGDWAALLDYARSGQAGSTVTETISPARIPELTAKARALMDLLGRTQPH